MTSLRIGIASIIQESNTFSPMPTTLADFLSHGLWLGEEADQLTVGSNAEIAGAVNGCRQRGATPVAIMRAWAMSGGPITAHAVDSLAKLLKEGFENAGPLDAAILCLHGALVSDAIPSVDGHFAEVVRAVVGPAVPLIVTYDLHANVTAEILSTVNALIGYHTYPHVDQGSTGERAASLAVLAAGGVPVHTVLAKRNLLIPPEAQAMSDEPMRSIRARADALTTTPILDVSLFPVQPWLDVPELGFAVTVTHAGAAGKAEPVAKELADEVWAERSNFTLDLVALDRAIITAHEHPNERIIFVHSADSPTAGATADDATVIGALAGADPAIRSIATVVDSPVVEACWRAGIGASIRHRLGSTLDDRWSPPIEIDGIVTRLGEDPVVLSGPAMTGQSISLGRWATIEVNGSVGILVTERAAPTFDPSTFRHVGLDPVDAAVVVVRSATLYRAGFHGLFDRAIVLDVPGASTPSFARLPYTRIPRPMYPLDGDAQQGSHDA